MSLSWVEGYFRLALLRACLLSCEEDPKEKLPCYDFTVPTRSTTEEQICKKKSSPALTPLKMHLTFDFTLDLQAISRTLNYAISQHLLFSSAFGRSTFYNLHLNNVCNTDRLLDIKCPPCICTDSAQSGQWWCLLGYLWLDCWWSWYPPRWWWLWG